MGPEQLAFSTAVLVNLVDVLGLQFTAPVLVPYGLSMGASTNEIALFTTVRYAAGFVSTFWMPFMSDKTGRKLVVLLSLVGSAVAYAIQGIAGHLILEHYDESSALGTMYLGRFVAGLFSGTTPVLRAYVTELTMPDFQLLKARMSILLAGNMAAGPLLSSIAGSIAVFGLYLPFYIATGIAAFVGLWAMLFFHEVQDLKRAERESSQALNAPSEGNENEEPIRVDSEASKNPDKETAGGQPYSDVVVLCMMSAMMFATLGYSAAMLIIPLQLSSESSFQLMSDTDDDTVDSGKLAQVVGLLDLALGMPMVFSMTVAYPYFMKRFGERKTTIFCGIVVCCIYVFHAYVPSRQWHIYVLNVLRGPLTGLILPIIGPQMSKYATIHYPTKLAMTQAFTFIGSSLGFGMGQLIAAQLYEVHGFKGAYLFSAGCSLVFAVLLVSGINMIESREPKQVIPLGKAKSWATSNRGMDRDDFIDEMAENYRRKLAAAKENLWSFEMQWVIRKRLSTLVPEIRTWQEDSQGYEHMEDLYALLLNNGASSELLDNIRTAQPKVALDVHSDLDNDVQHIVRAQSMRDITSSKRQSETNEAAL